MSPSPARSAAEHLDVLIVGAGISGIGAARYLKTELPSKSFAILEARRASGGTWDLFRYPGVRSDSDLHTFGYEFKPWSDEQSIADAPRILDYLRQTAAENGIDAHTRYHHKVLGASWSSDEARWTVEVERADTGERTTLTCGWLFCAGATTATTRASRPASRAWTGSRGPSCTPSTGRRTWTTPASASW